MNNEVVSSPFIGKKVKLRPFEKEDVDMIMKNWNRYETRRYLANVIPMSRSMEEEWIQQITQEQKLGKSYVFAIERLSDGELLGGCGLHNLSSTHKNAILGIVIYDPKNWNKGYGTETMRMLLNIGFNFLNLHRIELQVLEFNQRAIKVYEKVGFKTVGRRREAIFLEGKYVDSIIMDILKEEFDKTDNQ